MNNINKKNHFKGYAFKIKQTESNYIPNKYHNHIEGQKKENRIQETANPSKHRLYNLSIYILNQDGFVVW